MMKFSFLFFLKFEMRLLANGCIKLFQNRVSVRDVCEIRLINVS